MLKERINYGVSASDVLLYPAFKSLPRDPIHPKFNDEKELRKALWMLGINVRDGWIEEINTHRNLQKQVVTCLQFRGIERTDTAWLRSGCASIEAIKNSTRDKSLRKELDNIRNRG